VDGRYRYGGETHQLDLSEPERGHALHGLVCWARFEVLERDGSSVTVRHSIVPRTGYPFEVAVQARYELADDGLTVTVTAENLGGSPAPYGVGSHPYLVAGDGGVDAWTLELPATEVLEVTEERLVPTGRNAVAEAGFDFRSPGRLAGVEIDHAFTGLVPDDDGLVRARVRAADGGGVQCTWDGTALPWVQVHTADLPPPEASRAGLALEPMSCPPDAFNSGTDLRTLQPGEGCADTWMISAL
jgi:aldose 1-epimerase